VQQARRPYCRANDAAQSSGFALSFEVGFSFAPMALNIDRTDPRICGRVVGVIGGEMPGGCG
jgi:hypothetical protein